MTHHTTAQPQPHTIPLVAVPLKWHPPNDHLDSANFQAWVEQRCKDAPEPRLWLAGLLVSLNEIQIREAIQRGDRLVVIDSPIPPNWTTLVLEEAGRRLEAQGYKLPSLVVNITAVGGLGDV